jgi:hypothetical protein
MFVTAWSRPPYLAFRQRIADTQKSENVARWISAAFKLEEGTVVSIQDFVSPDPRQIPHFVTIVWSGASGAKLLRIPKELKAIAFFDIQDLNKQDLNQ